MSSLSNIITQPNIYGRPYATEWAKTIKGLVKSLDFGDTTERATALMHNTVLRIETREPWRAENTWSIYAIKPSEVRVYVSDRPCLRVSATLTDGPNQLCDTARLEWQSSPDTWFQYAPVTPDNTGDKYIFLGPALKCFVDHVAINQI